MIKKFGGQNFENEVANGTTLVDFYADWCGPCKMIAPVLEELDAKGTEVNILKVDTDANLEVAQSFNITSIPTLILFKDGKPVKEAKGFMPLAALENFINN